MSHWDNLCQVLKGLLVFESGDNLTRYWPDELILEQAKRDWITAQKIFEEASHPELIDYAIYNLKAAEKRYMYLLKQLRIEACEPAEFARGQEPGEV